MKIIYHPLMLETYDSTPAGAPGRLESAVEILSNHPDYEFIEPPLATEEQILRAHTLYLIEQVDRRERLSRMSLLAAGGAILAGEIAVKGEPAFALIRPPGHHASEDSHWGFCYLSNLPIALLHLEAQGLIESAFVLDFDLHTGDGTLNILGGKKGFHIHNPSGNGDEAYLKDVKRVLDESPDVDIIAVSAGFDEYIEDWGGNLSTQAFKEIGRCVYDFAKDNCDGRRFAVLEGGYNFADLGRNILAFCEGFRGL
ncbi:MAG: histone deacetylase family protein [Candidatus Thorarchaeota archaeon]